MRSHLTPNLKLTSRRAAWLAALVGFAAVGAVSAQPTPPPAPGPPPTVVEGPAKPAPSEEAPPVVVPTPAPLAVPPISEKEVAPAPPPPAAEEPKAPGDPVRRARYDVAVIEALDKVTAESLRFEAAVGHPVRYKNLVFTVKACERSAPDEPIDDSIAYLTVDSQPRAAPGRPALAPRQAFKGWMFASSPSLHPLEHPVYSAWLITCRAAAPASPPAR
jgi:hypothetical protein